MISFSCQLLAQASTVTRTGLEPSYYHRFPFPPWVSFLVLLLAVVAHAYSPYYYLDFH